MQQQPIAPTTTAAVVEDKLDLDEEVTATSLRDRFEGSSKNEFDPQAKAAEDATTRGRNDTKCRCGSTGNSEGIPMGGSISLALTLVPSH